MNYTLPVNGLKNFNFYYKPDGTGFLPGGTYSIDYLDASFQPVGTGDYPITYSPNTGYTNGVPVRGFNGTYADAFGLHGTLKIKVPGGGGAEAPLQNAYLLFLAAGTPSRELRTNGNGYFSLYYDSAVSQSFLFAAIHWNLYITGSYNGCFFGDSVQNEIIWLPNTDPNSSAYYVNEGASWDIGTRVLISNKPGCEP